MDDTVLRDWRTSEDPWATLRRYNTEVSRGLVHTDEWHAEMANLQRQFNDEQHVRMIEQGMRDSLTGHWFYDAPRPHWWRFW